MDQDAVIAGQGFQQGPGPFTAGTFSGSYGLNVRHVVPNGSGEARQNGTGPTAADGAGNLAGFVDLNGPGSDLPLSGNFTSSSNGVFTGHPSRPRYLFYPRRAPLRLLSGGRLRERCFIETDNAQLTIGIPGASIELGIREFLAGPFIQRSDHNPCPWFAHRDLPRERNCGEGGDLSPRLKRRALLSENFPPRQGRPFPPQESCGVCWVLLGEPRHKGPRNL